MRGLFLGVLVIFLGMLYLFYTSLCSTKPLLHKLEGDHTGYIRIITPSGSIGTDTDAQIYHKLLPNSYIIYVDYDDMDSHIEVGKEVLINLYIEHCSGASVRHQKFPAKQNWLMVNHEMLSWSPFLRQIDLFICKTKCATRLIQKLKEQKNLKGKVLYTKHTSKDIRGGQKDWNLFVHFAGKSWLKQTEAVLEAWIKNKGFPEYSYPKLVVTCRDRCLSTRVLLMMNDFDSYGKHKKYPNIQVKSFIPTNEYQQLQRAAGVYVCPSLTEGYGHYMNEGRSASAVIITVDGSPMNELVNETNGILIPPVSRYSSGHELGSPDWRLEGSQVHMIDSNGVEDAVRKYYSLSTKQKRKMSSESRRKYDEDGEFLKSALQSILKILH